MLNSFTEFITYQIYVYLVYICVCMYVLIYLSVNALYSMDSLLALVAKVSKRSVLYQKQSLFRISTISVLCLKFVFLQKQASELIILFYKEYILHSLCNEEFFNILKEFQISTWEYTQLTTSSENSKTFLLM